MILRPNTYATLSSSYESFKPVNTTFTATNNSLGTNQVTLTVASSTGVTDWVFVNGGTYTGNSWNGWRQVIATTATSITIAVPTPGTYVSGTVTAQTQQVYGVTTVNSKMLISANAACYVVPFNPATDVPAPNTDQFAFLVPANTYFTLPIAGLTAFNVKASTGTIVSMLETN